MFNNAIVSSRLKIKYKSKGTRNVKGITSET